MSAVVENAVDAMNEAVDGIVDLFRAEHGRIPERAEIYEIYRFAMQGRLFADDQRALERVA